MVKRYENHGDPRLPLGLFVHESDYESLAARLAEAERRRERIRGVAAEPGENYVIRLANIVTVIDAPDGFSGPT